MINENTPFAIRVQQTDFQMTDHLYKACPASREGQRPSYATTRRLLIARTAPQAMRRPPTTNSRGNQIV